MDHCSKAHPPTPAHPSLPTGQLPFFNFASSKIVFVFLQEGLLEAFLLLLANSFCQFLNSEAREPCPKAPSGFSDDLAMEDQSHLTRDLAEWRPH